MKHLTPQQLLEHYYQQDSAAASHVTECSLCRSEFQQLSAWLDELRDVEAQDPGPEPGNGFEQRLWSGIQAALPQRVSTPNRWVLPASLAGLSAAAATLAILFAGHPAETSKQDREAGGDRVLRFVLTDHLERSHHLLTELEQLRPAKAAFPAKAIFQDERSRARDLLEENRLLRAAALQRGETSRAAVLDDLGRTLLTVANSPPEMSRSELLALQQRLHENGLLAELRRPL